MEEGDVMSVVRIDPYYKELAHMSVKVEESHDLPSGDLENLVV